MNYHHEELINPALWPTYFTLCYEFRGGHYSKEVSLLNAFDLAEG